MTEADVRLVASMYEYRDTAKFLLGDRYKGFCDEIAEIINDVHSKRPDLSILAIGTHLAKVPANSPQRTICIIGAVVEMMEPSHD